MITLKKLVSFLVLITPFLITIALWFVSNISNLSRDFPSVILSLGRLSGLLAVNFVLLQLVLIGRAPWIERTFGLDKLSRLHHTVGQLILGLFILHPLTITFSYSQFNSFGFLDQFLEFLLNFGDLLKAALGLLIFFLTVGVSFYVIKKKLKYETWYFLHLLNYLAILLIFGHQIALGGDFVGNQLFVIYWYLLYLLVALNHLIFRFFKPLWLYYYQRFKVAKIVPETPDTYSLYISCKNVDQFPVRPGQFMIFRFLAKSFWWQAHPFSLSYVPKNNLLRITVKNSGDFTSAISQLPINTPVVVDGPLGIFYPSNSYLLKANSYLFIAGGIGITPIRALIEQLAPTNNLVLLYSNKTVNGIVFQKELEDLSSRHQFPIYYFITDGDTPKLLATGSQQLLTYDPGRIDKERISSLVPDLKNREIYLCGPGPMMSDIRQGLKELGVNDQKVHFEKFSL